jgi:hypothetical protein
MRRGPHLLAKKKEEFMRSFVLMSMAALLCVAATAQADVITNGDFETGDFTGWTVRDTPNGHSILTDVIMYDIDGGGPLPESLAARFSVGERNYDGTQQGIELVQDVSLVGGIEYTFDADVAAWRHISGSNAEGGVFSLILDGSVLDTWQCGGIGQPYYPTDKYGHVTGTYTPGSSGTYEIGMRITRPYTVPSDGPYQMVDNFTGIPEPATLALLALGGLTALRRR